MYRILVCFQKTRAEDVDDYKSADNTEYYVCSVSTFPMIILNTIYAQCPPLPRQDEDECSKVVQFGRLRDMEGKKCDNSLTDYRSEDNKNQDRSGPGTLPTTGFRTRYDPRQTSFKGIVSPEFFFVLNDVKFNLEHDRLGPKAKQFFL